MNKKTTNCQFCEGSGIYYRPNGDADYDMEYCSCVEGGIAERKGAMWVLLPVKFETSEGEVNITKK